MSALATCQRIRFCFVPEFPIPSAMDAGEGRVLITGGYGAGSAMIKVEKKGDGSYGVAELFKTIEFGSHTQPPILYKGNFYVMYTVNERSDGLVCMSMDGQIKWKTGEAPVAFADGKLLIRDQKQLRCLTVAQ